MYKILITALIAVFMTAGKTAEAQRLVARVSVPGINIGYNSGAAYGYGVHPYKRRVMAQRARLNRVKSMAMYDGYVTRRERAMIRAEQRRLAYMTNGRRSRF